jgi:hypothetical protein
MTQDVIVPTEPFSFPLPEATAPGAPAASGVRVTPHIKFRGAEVTVRLRIAVPVLGEDEKTFTLTPANHWSDTKTFLKSPSSFDVTVEVQPGQRRIHVHVHKSTLFKNIDYDHYVPYGGLVLPGDFGRWSPHRGPEFDALRRAHESAQPIGKASPLTLDQNTAGVSDQLALLGDRDFMRKASEALGQGAATAGLEASDGSVLFALGPMGDLNMSVGISGYLGFWLTTGGRGGFFSGPGAHMGSLVGANFQAVLTVVIASDGRSAIENFESFHVARGVAGEALTGSAGFLGDVQSLDLYGILVGLGGGGGTPAGGYVGAMRLGLIEF